MSPILNWIEELNKTTHVKIINTQLSKSDDWCFDYETGTIHNQNNTFFSVVGIKGNVNGEEIEQPILLQSEIGYIGILCQDFDGETKYLMQAKIEPGNVNCVQISPTIQATKSNFTQQHGGKKPNYLEFFINANKYQVIADQIHSEQSSRFYKKRNRNMIIKVPESLSVNVEGNFRWMTLKEIKYLMTYKNLVNMDTRTVLSCIPYFDNELVSYDLYLRRISGENNLLYNSMHYKNYASEILLLYHKINNYKMFTGEVPKLVRLDHLEKWEITDNEIVCKEQFPYKVIFCEIEIEGREVTHWNQPLFQANGLATFGLIVTIDDGILKFLVKLSPEIGSFDFVEIGPTIQKEYGEVFHDGIEAIFEKAIKRKSNVWFDSILSEEGGRFYHEENRNLIVYVKTEELIDLPTNYAMVSYAALNHLNMVNNCLNIQLRNLLSTLEV